MDKIVSYKDLQIWKNGINLVGEIYNLTRGMPKEEMFGLVSQMRRAAVSVPSNIAEGFARQSFREYIQFLSIAVSSCAELDTQLVIALQQKYISDIQYQTISTNLEIEVKMTKSLINKIRSKD